MSIEGFTLSTHYSRDIHIHGGVAIYIKKDVCFSELDEIRDLSQELCCECCAVNYENWHSVYDAVDVEAKFKEFNSIITYYFEMSFPLLNKPKQSLNTNKKWITNGIKVSSKNLKNLHALASTGNEADREFYNVYKRIYNRVIREAKKRYYNSYLVNSKNKVKSSWQLIKNFTNGYCEKGVNEIVCSDTTINDPQIIADVFNEHFNNIHLKEKHSIPKKDCQHIIPNNANTFFCIQPIALKLPILLKKRLPVGRYRRDDFTYGKKNG
nr:unnamed protein product [Callosobruchus analis]